MLALTTKREDARPGRGEDRIEVVSLSDRTVVVVADGAGGVAGGATTADGICKAVVERWSIGDSKRFFERRRFLPDRIGAAPITSAQGT